ncbi:MAG: hypothetical protein AMXMBFR64_26050 [Myxococcales bacterium]
MAHGKLVGWMVAAVLSVAVSAVAQPVDQVTLPRLLEGGGFKPPKQFKALVLKLDDKGAVIAAYDTGGSSEHRDDWWPASCVKLFAATAALEKTKALGLTPKARGTWLYGSGPKTLTVEQVVRRALTPSDNKAYDMLVELVGFDDLNGRFFTPRNGFSKTVLLRAYSGRVKDPETNTTTTRHSPPIELVEGGRTVKVPERAGKRQFDCPEEGNCTTLRELAENLRRVMMHEKLPEDQRFALGAVELKLLRSAMSAKRSRGNGVLDGLRRGFGDVKIQTWSKPGYAREWFSDVVFVKRGDTGERFIVSMAGWPGRSALDEAAEHVGRLLATRKL